jgi:ABC-2 type transport system ATP-binding protein
VSAIAVERLGKRYGDLVALSDASFAVEAGEIVALLGPNGAGKTTTIEILEGFRAPSAGAVRVLGVDPRRGDRRWRARLGLVFQSTGLDPHLTVRECLGAFARVFPRPRPLGEVLALIDLEADADVRVAQLSGGQRRRADLGLAIVGRPDLLVLDEPTTGLDPAARRRIWTLVAGLADAGTTVLLSTHHMEEAERLARRVVVLARGRVVADAAPEALRARAAPTRVRWVPPAGAPLGDLPPALARHLDPERRELLVAEGDVAGVLEALIGWARGHGVGLDGLEVGPPSLEDAYLRLVGAGSDG